MCCFLFFFFKQKTAYEMRISDWSSDVCSSDLGLCNGTAPVPALNGLQPFCPAAARGPLQDYVYGQNGNDNIYAVYQNTPAYGKSRTHGASGVLEYEFSDAAVLKSTTAEIGRASCRERVWQDG